jgi:plasmid maintenance system antidote protein VapI
MKPAALAEALSVSEARAKAIIAAAKKVKPAKKAKK